MNGAQGFPNPNNETLQPNTTIEGTHKRVQPFFVIAMKHKRRVTARSYVVQCGAKFYHLHPLGHSLDRCNRKGPRTWFMDLHVVELLVQPTTSDPQVGQPATQPLPPRVPNASEPGDKITCGPQAGCSLTIKRGVTPKSSKWLFPAGCCYSSPLGTLDCGWATSGPGGYTTHAAWGDTNTSERGTK